MDKSRVSMLMAAAASALFGCSYPFMIGYTTLRTKDGGEITKRVFNDGRVTYQRGYGTVVESDPGQPSYITAQREFNEAEELSSLQSSRKAAAAERQALAPVSASPQSPTPASPGTVGPKVDLPTQTYQPPSGYSHPPSGTYPH